MSSCIESAFVTGATGFIGRNLVARLVQSGVRVRALIRESDSRPEWQESVDLIVGDVFQQDALRAGAQGVDVVYHLAGIGSPSSPEWLHPRIIRTNAVGTMNVLVAASNARAKRVVLSSSASVYGKRSSTSLTEDLIPEPATVYASSKHIAEEMCASATEHQGIQTIVLRYFNVYGAGESDRNSMLMPTLLSRLSHHKPVTLYGGGEQTRDFIYMDDVVNAAILAGNAPQLEHEIINIGSGRAIRILDVVEMLKNKLQSASKIVYAPERPEEIRDSVANIDKASSLLGFRPRVTLSEGLDRVIERHSVMRLGGSA